MSIFINYTWAAGLSLALFLGCAQGLGAAERAPTAKTDCGVHALYVLLHLKGHPVSIDRLEEVLPPRREDGYSMAELSAAADSLGLYLEGVRFARGDKPLDHPAIAFLQDARGGHFTVLRPVGTTGSMVQVIDPPHAPWITDYDRLFDARPWTGRVLMPRERWPVRRTLSLLLAGLTGVLFLALRRRNRLMPSSRS
jgi:hypothetical protein